MKLNTITFAIISLGFSQVAIAEPAETALELVAAKPSPFDPEAT